MHSWIFIHFTVQSYKIIPVSLQESLNQKQAEYTEDELFFHTENKNGRIFLETTPEEYLILSDPIHTDDHQKIIQALLPATSVTAMPTL